MNNLAKLNALEKKVLGVACVDQTAALRILEDALSENVWDASERLLLLRMRLPYVEHVARAARGESTYVSDDLFEDQFPLSKNDVKEFCDLAYRVLTDHPHEVLTILCAAQADHLRGDYQAHDQRLAPLQGRNDVDVRYSTARFCNNAFDVKNSILDGYFKGLPTVITHRALPDAGAVVFFTCGPDYLRRFAKRLVRSIAENTPNVIIHAHLQDVDVEGVAAWMEFMRETCGDRFAVTSEMPNLIGRADARYYYAGNRLVRLHQFGLKLPTLFLDTDTLAFRTLNPVFERLENHDVLLCRMRGRIAVHSQLNATVNAWSATENARAYLRDIAAGIAASFNSGLWPWGIDQMTLWSALINERFTRAKLNAAALGAHVYDDTLNCAIWPQKLVSESVYFPVWKAVMQRFGTGEALPDTRINIG